MEAANATYFPAWHLIDHDILILHYTEPFCQMETKLEGIVLGWSPFKMGPTTPAITAYAAV